MVFCAQEFWYVRVINREVDCERTPTNSALGDHGSTQVVLTCPRNYAGGFTSTRNGSTRRANVTEVDSYSSTIFAELSNLFKV
jgi:hypothetical protein